MEDTVPILRALADEERLRIVRLLLATSSRVCVCELVDILRLPQYEVSRQLRVLRDAGIVSCERRGTWAYYGIAESQSGFALAVLDAVARHVPGEWSGSDLERAATRLGLRLADVCVVGYEPDRPFRERIPAASRRPRRD